MKEITESKELINALAEYSNIIQEGKLLDEEQEKCLKTCLEDYNKVEMDSISKDTLIAAIDSYLYLFHHTQNIDYYEKSNIFVKQLYQGRGIEPE